MKKNAKKFGGFNYCPYLCSTLNNKGDNPQHNTIMNKEKETNSQKADRLMELLRRCDNGGCIHYVTHNGIRNWWLLCPTKTNLTPLYRAVGMENIEKEVKRILTAYGA